MFAVYRATADAITSHKADKALEGNSNAAAPYRTVRKLAPPDAFNAEQWPRTSGPDVHGYADALCRPTVQAARQANIHYKIDTLELRLKSDLGNWGLHGSRNGAALGMLLAGVSALAISIAFPLAGIALPAVGLILTLSCLALGFAVGLGVETLMRRRWHKKNPQSAITLTKEIAELRAAMAVHADPKLEGDRLAYERLDALQKQVDGGFKHALGGSLSGIFGLNLRETFTSLQSYPEFNDAQREAVRKEAAQAQPTPLQKAKAA